MHRRGVAGRVPEKVGVEVWQEWQSMAEGVLEAVQRNKRRDDKG